MLPWLAQTLLGKIVGGTASSAWSWARKLPTAWQFNQVFGQGVASDRYALVYAELALADQAVRFPYAKPEGLPEARFSISRPVSGSELRCVNYLASSIGGLVGTAPSVRSDLDVRRELDCDFVSFGGPNSNLKSADCQSNGSNRLALFDQRLNLFLDRSSSLPLVEFDSGFDYGLILKVRPAQFPKRVWIMCAGIGEWGTSGAAWFLANKWREIRARAKGRPFAVVVRVRESQDQSAEMLSITSDCVTGVERSDRLAPLAR